MKKGDIVLTQFPFSDLRGRKLRPAVVVYSDVSDVTVCFISTRMDTLEKNDLLLKPSKENGLQKSSFVRVYKIATIQKAIVRGLLGELSLIEIEDLNQKMIEVYKLTEEFDLESQSI